MIRSCGDVQDTVPPGTTVAGSDWIASLLGHGVAASELRRAGDPAWLLPAERLALRAPCDKRLQEFAAGRACARHALGQLGLPPLALLPDDDRCPSWPAPVVGSITHTAGLCAAVVAPRGRYAALGLDAEVAEDVTPDVLAYICTPAELAWLARLPETLRASASALIFSAKEAFYKCQFALSRQWLEFHEVTLELTEHDLLMGRFTVHPLIPIRGLAPQARWPGRFRLAGHWVIAGIAFPAH